MGLRIVCVDDDVALLQMLKTSLAAVLNAEVVTMAGAQDAVQRLSAEQAPHIIIVDYMMPSLDGLSFLSAVNALPGWDKTCILMLSAVGGNIKQAALKRRVYAMIDKPIKPLVLAQTVSELYQKFSAGAPPPLAAEIERKQAAAAKKKPR
jgi:two-component system chemotaxis response regulator CheY